MKTKTNCIALVLCFAVVLAFAADKPPTVTTIKLSGPQENKYLRANRRVTNAQRVHLEWHEKLRNHPEYKAATEEIEAAVKIMNSVIAEAKEEHKCPDCDFNVDELALIKTPAKTAPEQAKAVKK